MLILYEISKDIYSKCIIFRIFNCIFCWIYRIIILDYVDFLRNIIIQHNEVGIKYFFIQKERTLWAWQHHKQDI